MSACDCLCSQLFLGQVTSSRPVLLVSQTQSADQSRQAAAIFTLFSISKIPSGRTTRISSPAQVLSQCLGPSPPACCRSPGPAGRHCGPAADSRLRAPPRARLYALAALLFSKASESTTFLLRPTPVVYRPRAPSRAGLCASSATDRDVQQDQASASAHASRAQEGPAGPHWCLPVRHQPQCHQQVGRPCRGGR